MQDYMTAKERLDFRKKYQLLKDIAGALALVTVFYGCMFLVTL